MAAVSGNEIFKTLNIDNLLIHTTQKSYCYSKEGFSACKSFFVENPKFSTGVGDNFNAGFCVAKLIGLDMENSLILANGVSGYYVTEGRSPDVKDMIRFLEEKLQLNLYKI